jgi:transposase
MCHLDPNSSLENSPEGDRPSELPQAPPPTIITIGIDWADQQHQYAATLPDGSFETGSFQQKPQAIQHWIAHFQTRFPHSYLEIAIETSRGALINALLEHRCVSIFPINPHAMACYRKAFAHGGGKSDPVDARLIMQYLSVHRPQLRPLQLNQPLTRELGQLAQHRRALVEQRVALANRLKDLLKGYFPAVLELSAAKPYAHFIIALLLHYPTLEAVQAAGKNRIRKLFFGLGTRNKIEQRLEVLMEAKPITTDPTLLRTHARYTQALAQQIQILNQSIKQYEREIKRLLQTHQDYPIFKSLPGASDKTHARLIAALGDDRNRFDSANSLQCAAGIAPLTEQSGKSRHVRRRWAATTFMMQTFFEYAGLSIPHCAWAKTFYQSQLAKGNSSSMAKRALAFKWIRIIYHCWKTRTPYDEPTHLKRLAQQGSPLAQKTPT